MALGDNFLEKIEKEAKQLQALTDDLLLESRQKWLGKDGIIKSLFAELKTISPEKKPLFAARLNNLKEFCEGLFAASDQKLEELKIAKSLANEFIDPSAGLLAAGIGRISPITYLERKINQILKPFGFEVISGPEIESQYYCFDSLNIPPHHPARDMQDTFYVEGGYVLRTHTTSIQARIFHQAQQKKDRSLPIKIVTPGKAYRNEKEDANHQAMFHQYELVWLDHDLTLAELHGLIEHILKNLFGKERKVRFVQKFYPYTEPSIGAQINCNLCSGTGCIFCDNCGWVTVGGAGMIHPKVLIEFGFDPEKVSGMAFGLGSSRLAAQFAGIQKLKPLYEGDLRILGEV
ncbi:MAG TPA: phenylalanine--tRNA ligase subunit alpha [Oligoflexia bacterium]|mgnify:CR=1 FL=1|nr:phenylalanine--tRNA ligase subunit alpha [Oligoflexia bacterium]HMP27196.1 phenylalanine--tRNA ligase subunit alpha [Oligoflexia bacterium]